MVTHPNHVWSADITSIRLARGFVYLVAVIDWYLRKVLAWRVSNTLESGFCVEGLEHASQRYGIPEIFNTDLELPVHRGGLHRLLKAHGIALSMGRGRALNHIAVERLWQSVEHEDVYLRGSTTLAELQRGLTDYFVFYNTERIHQALHSVTPDAVYRTASGGGATIVDQFGKTEHTRPETPKELECRGSAVQLHVNGYPLKLGALVS